MSLKHLVQYLTKSNHDCALAVVLDIYLLRAQMSGGALWGTVGALSPRCPVGGDRGPLFNKIFIHP